MNLGPRDLRWAEPYPVALGYRWRDVATGTVIKADDRIAVQAVTGYLADPGPPAGWQTIRDTPDAVVWGRAR